MSLGEAGGAGQVVDEALVAIAAAHHGQLRQTAIAEAALEATNMASLSAFFEAIARDGLALTEAFAPTVFALAEAGDGVAIDVVSHVAQQHGRDVVGLIDQLDFAVEPVTIVCAGGLHTSGSSIFSSSFERQLLTSRWNVRSVVLEVVPVVGALVDAAVRKLGRITPEQRSILIASAGDVEDFGTRGIAVAS